MATERGTILIEVTGVAVLCTLCGERATFVHCDEPMEYASRWAEPAFEAGGARCAASDQRHRQRVDPMNAPVDFIPMSIPDHVAGLTKSNCEVCLGSGWVCENHPTVPWEGEVQAPVCCPCGAPGMPCRCTGLK